MCKDILHLNKVFSNGNIVTVTENREGGETIKVYYNVYI